MKLKDIYSLEGKFDQPTQHNKKQRHYFINKGLSIQGYGFAVVMYGCDIWTIKKAECWRFDAFELWCWRRLLRVHWTARRSNQSILKEIRPGIYLEGMMLKLKLQYFWPLHAKSWLLGKDSDAGRDWGQEEKGMTEDEMAGWHHWFDGRESEWTPGVGNGLGGLECCCSWSCQELDMTDWLNWTEWSSIFPTFFNFRYNLSQTPYDYTGEVRNKFKGFDLTECLKSYGRRFLHCTGGRNQDHPQKKNAKRQNVHLRRPYKYLWKEQKWQAKEKRKDIPFWMQSSKVIKGEIRKPSWVISARK